MSDPNTEARNFPNFASRSAELFARAQSVFPGGSTRNQTYFPPHMVYADRAEGCRLFDVDGHELIDFHNDYTVTIVGHRHAQVDRAVTEQIGRVTCSALAVESEIELAETICARNPGFERLRFVVTGSEAVMNAMKAARAFTGRPKIAKCEGAYHGSNDFAEVSLDSTPQNWGDGVPASVGFSAHVPQGVMDNMVVVPFDDVDGARAILEAHADDLAGILLDLAPSRCGARPASPEFIAMLEDFRTRTGAVLIVDEVITFRMSVGGAQRALGCTPDLTTFGKIIGGGLPIGALAGRADIMDVFDATRGKPMVPQSGTFTAHPLSMVAGKATLEIYDQAAADRLNDLGDKARRQLADAIADAGIEGQVTGSSSLFAMVFSSDPLGDYRDMWRATSGRHTRIMSALFPKLIDRGVLIAAWGFGCLSTPMTQAEIDRLCETVGESLREVRDEVGDAAAA